MIINIKEKATRIKLGYSMFMIIYLLLLVISLMVNFLPDYKFEIFWSIFCVTALIIYLIIGYHYIYFSDQGDKVVFRYQSLNPFFSNALSIEIPKNSFAKFEIRKSLFGIKHKITLYQKSTGGDAKYPSVNISALSKVQKQALIQSLNALVK
jgi:hypothetical protein